MIRSKPLKKYLNTISSKIPLAPPEFESSVNPIPTRGGRLCPPHYCQHTWIPKPKDSSVQSNILSLGEAKQDFLINSGLTPQGSKIKPNLICITVMIHNRYLKLLTQKPPSSSNKPPGNCIFFKEDIAHRKSRKNILNFKLILNSLKYFRLIKKFNP